MTFPTPSIPVMAGSGTGIYLPVNFALSEGLIDDPYIFISN